MWRGLSRHRRLVAFVSSVLMLLGYIFFGLFFFDLFGNMLGGAIGSACASDVLFAIFLLAGYPEFVSTNVFVLPERRRPLLLNVLLAFAACSLVWFSGILMSTWVMNNVSDPMYTAAYTGSVPFYQTLLLGLFAAPLCEELLVRGYIFGRLREDVSTVVSAVVSAVFFAAMHGTLTHIPLTFALGLFLALLRSRGAPIVACMAMHSFSNALSLFVATRVSVPPFVVEAPFAHVVWVSCVAVLVLLLVRERRVLGR